MIKILVSDYDDTFYLDDELIKENILSIKEFRKNGNIFIIATGRSYYDFMKKVDKYNIEYDYLMINHGSTIIDSRNNILNNVSISNIVKDEIIKELELDKTDKNFCCKNIDSRASLSDSDLTKIYARYNNRLDAINVNNKINDKFSNYVNSYVVGKRSVEVISSHINKSLSINKIIDILNIKDYIIYTVGDGYSDYEMIRDYNGYCMKNSVQKLKSVAIGEVESVKELIEKIN